MGLHIILPIKTPRNVSLLSKNYSHDNSFRKGRLLKIRDIIKIKNLSQNPRFTCNSMLHHISLACTLSLSLHRSMELKNNKNI